MKLRKKNAPMKKKLVHRPVARIVGLFIVAGLVCGGMLLPKSTAVQEYLTRKKIDAVIEDYTDNVVLKTLDAVVGGIDAFNTAVARLVENPTDSAVEDAARAWREARTRWQSINTFSYGPCAFYDFDKQVASWPIDRPMIEYSISRIASGKEPFDAHILRRKEYSTQRGFLTAEYLLFRDAKPRRAALITPAELRYLQAVAQAMLVESLDFQASWLGSDRMSRAAAARLAEEGLPPRKSYAAEFKHPGTPGSRYYSPSVVLQEMFQESQTVVEDTCPLIEEWLGSGDPDKSEARESRNAAADIINLLQGVENAYLGGMKGHRGKAMADLVAGKDKVLDRRIRIALANVRYRVAAIGDPYAPPERDRDLQVRRAAASCRKLAAKIAAAAAPVCLDPATRPWAAYVQ